MCRVGVWQVPPVHPGLGADGEQQQRPHPQSLSEVSQDSETQTGTAQAGTVLTSECGTGGRKTKRLFQISSFP